MKWFKSHDLMLYVDVFPFKTGNQSDGMLKCLTANILGD